MKLIEILTMTTAGIISSHDSWPDPLCSLLYQSSSNGKEVCTNAKGQFIACCNCPLSYESPLLNQLAVVRDNAQGSDNVARAVGDISHKPKSSAGTTQQCA